MKQPILDYIMKFSPWVSAILLLFFSMTYLFLSPYPGFSFTSGSNDVTDIFSVSEGLEIGDKLVKVDGLDMRTFNDGLSTRFLPGKNSGDLIELVVLRGGQEVSIEWTYLGFTPQALVVRVTNLWPIAFLFWIVGTATHVLIRPRDTLWRLLITFNFITAIWFITGATTKYHFFLTPFIFRSSLWLAIPVYLHLHWNFPKPLLQLPIRFWLVVYAFFGIIGISEFLLLPPPNTHLLAFATSLVASIGFVFLHFFLRPKERSAIRVLLWAMAFSFLPVLILVVASIFEITSGLLAGVMFALPIMPMAYFYAIFRHRLGGLELRANRIISVYLFVFLAASLTTVVTPLLLNWLDFPGSSTLIAVSLSLALTLFTVVGFRRFERFVEERVLSMPLPPDALMHSYARQITGSLNHTNLNKVLQETILPSMLIRQSSLLYLDKQTGWHSILDLDIQTHHKVQLSQIPALLEQTNKYLPIQLQNKTEADLDWVRLVLPLDIEDEVIGLWLFGRRDPEDFYSQRDIAFLQTLANQTAIALANLSLSTDLRSLYMANVKRQEDEKENIARELHDDVLNELAVLSMKMDGNVSKEFQQDYQNLTDRIRSTVQDLRPPMLNHGLHTALEELGQTLNKRANHASEIEISIPHSSYRFDSLVEAHLFRIVQQACENAIRHADAQHIIVSGSIGDEIIELEISDNGKGFSLEADLNLASLLAEKHYGIASMVERAELVGAHLRFASTPTSGTTITVLLVPS